MNYQKHFKPEDVETAQAEVKCIEDLFRLAKLNIESGNFEQAHQRLIDLLNSIRRLEGLNVHKESDEEFKKGISELLKTTAKEQRNAFFAEQRLRVYFNDRTV